MKTFFKRLVYGGLALGLFLALLPALAVRAAGPICYVKANATGAATGASWADAYTTLQDALADTGCTEIWVAAGVYYPDEGGGQTDNDRHSTFQLRNGVAIYGGFAGTETARDQRDPATYITVLSGDIDHETNPDTTNAHGVVTDPNNIQGNNAYHVVTGSGTDNSAVLDGFTITAGQANGGSWPDRWGGGFYDEDGSPTLRKVTFAGNSAYYAGGGMYNLGGSPALTEITFSSNSVQYDGGGMCNIQGNPTLTKVLFSANSAVYSDGGGMYNSDGSPTLTNVTFSDNSAHYGGGGMFNFNGNPSLTDVTFSNNSADYESGGGIFNSDGSPTLTNVTFSGNNAFSDGGGMANYNCGSLKLSNVTFSENSAAVGGGMYNYGHCNPTLTNATFSNNWAEFGGGMDNFNNKPTLSNITFFGNSAWGDGGGMYNSLSDPVLTNVTFVDNSAQNGSGGGIFNSGSKPVLTNVTFASNAALWDGGGMANYDASHPTLINVIIANSTYGGDCVNYTNSTIASNSSNNLIEDDAHACGLTDGVNGNIIGQDPKLGTLTDFGGAGRRVVPLKAGSPAIDAGTNNGCPSTDQRGMPRPQGNRCDIGAYEVHQGSIAVTVNQASTQADPTNTSPVHFTAVFSPFVDPSTFDGSDVTLSGTAPGILTATVTEIAPYDHTTYDIAVTGMAGDGTVVASIGAGRVADWDGNTNSASTSTDNEVTYDATAPTVAATNVGHAYIFGPTVFTVTYSEPVYDPPGNTDPNDVTNPANYLLVERGRNGAFDTVSCAGGVQGDDAQITVNTVTYDNATFTATVNINNGVPLPDGTYRLFVCGTTSITDIVGNHLNDGHDSIYGFVVQHPVPPKTGFPRGAMTDLPPQPADKTYSTTSLTLVIPKIGVTLPIVGVPLSEGGWDVSWLGSAAGWLEGTAFPTWAGNTVLTAHVWNADNTPGPFLHLKDLRYGDRIEIRGWGQVYVYEVRENRRLPAQGWAATHLMLKHTAYDVLTLVTCEGYDPLTRNYPFRRMVQAVLVAVR